MPIKSEAQRKKFQQLVAEGKMSKEIYEKMESETPAVRLPEYSGKARIKRVKVVQ